MAGESLSETSPLLEHALVYQRFSRRMKWVIVALVAWCGLMPLFVAGAFMPSIPQIAEDLDTTGSIVSLAVSVHIFSTSIGALSGAAYSTFYGRRIVYLVMLPLFCIGSFGVARSASVPELLTWRFVQAFGTSPGLSLGAGVIGDIFQLEERGTAMGVFFSASLLGPALAPPVGGFFTQYSTWRVLQLVLGITGCGIFALISMFFPETSHPGSRGIDKIPDGQSKIVFVNPMRPIALFRSPNLFLVSLSGFLVLLTDYILLVPLAYTIGARYHITSTAIIGACFLPSGLGNMIGAPLAGRLSDRVVVAWRARRGGKWYPEDRLRAAIYGALIFIPLSMLGFGLLIEYVPGMFGLILTLVCLFVHGVGIDIALSPSAAYTVDVMHSRSAEAMAAMMGLRALMLSVCVSGVLPAIETFGVLSTNSAAALMSWVACLILWLMIQFGTELRAWVDVGYSTAENN
ncbi:hypothetical protein E4T56_gene12846 [Termitomyces sp. T112]|nr:hypothetical protein E4T56_gene12846 [Termitomyces sp. T112]